MDDAGREYRRLYFLRRSIATFQEIHSAFQQLSHDADFRKMVVHLMNPEFKQVWKDAVKYFETHAENDSKSEECHRRTLFERCGQACHSGNAERPD